MSHEVFGYIAIIWLCFMNIVVHQETKELKARIKDLEEWADARDDEWEREESA